MRVEKTIIEGCLLFTPKVFSDERGFFKETYHHERYLAAGVQVSFVQDNFSYSTKGVLRGLHLQVTRPQGKLVQALDGEIFDVCVDLRSGSSTFKKWYGVNLSSENHQQLYIPPGCAHGFYVISPKASVYYKCSDLYVPTDEKTLLWNDQTININWPLEKPPVISAKDQQGLKLDDLWGLIS